MNEREADGMMRLQGVKKDKVCEFKNFGSAAQSNRKYSKEVRKRVQAGYKGWRTVSGVIYDKRKQQK